MGRELPSSGNGLSAGPGLRRSSKPNGPAGFLLRGVRLTTCRPFRRPRFPDPHFLVSGWCRDLACRLQRGLALKGHTDPGGVHPVSVSTRSLRTTKKETVMATGQREKGDMHTQGAGNQGRTPGRANQGGMGEPRPGPRPRPRQGRRGRHGLLRRVRREGHGFQRGRLGRRRRLLRRPQGRGRHQRSRLRHALARRHHPRAHPRQGHVGWPARPSRTRWRAAAATCKSTASAASATT